MDFSQMMSYRALFPRTILFRKNSAISKERMTGKRTGFGQSTALCLSFSPKPWINEIFSLLELPYPLLLGGRVLGSPAPGQQFIREIPLPRNIDTQRKVWTRHQSPHLMRQSTSLAPVLLYTRRSRKWCELSKRRREYVCVGLWHGLQVQLTAVEGGSSISEPKFLTGPPRSHRMTKN